MEYASRGVANAGLTTGIIGTALGVLNGGLGMLGGYAQPNAMNGCCPDNQPINRYEAQMMNELAAKDQHIALLEADKYTDSKIADLAERVNNRFTNVEAQLAQQAVYNATSNGTIACLSQQVAELQSLTKLVVPNSSVCPGWGNVTVSTSPSVTGTTVR